MRKTKRAITLFLAVLMIFGIATPAFAVEHDYTQDIETLSNEFHPFTDVRYSSWYAQSVQYVWMRNIMTGSTSTTFNQSGNLTRAEVTALIFRLQNGRRANQNDSRNNNFSDVNNEWFAAYVTWASNNNIVTGTSPTTFNPNGFVTRQEFAVMIYRFAMSNMGGMNDNGRQSSQWSRFNDRGDIASWAYNALRWMNYNGIVTGTDNGARINPRGNATRAEASAMMMRTVQTMGRTVNGHSPDFAPRPPAPQSPQPQNIDTLTQNGACWRDLHQAGFSRRDIQGAFEREMIRLTNNIRRDHGLPQFTSNATLGNVARWRAEESLRYGSWTHTSEATGLMFTDHFNAITGLRIEYAAENFGGTQNTPQQLIQAWMNSPGHRDFILAGHHSSIFRDFTGLVRIGTGFDFDVNSTNNTRATLWLSTADF